MLKKEEHYCYRIIKMGYIKFKAAIKNKKIKTAVKAASRQTAQQLRKAVTKIIVITYLQAGQWHELPSHEAIKLLNCWKLADSLKWFGSSFHSLAA